MVKTKRPLPRRGGYCIAVAGLLCASCSILFALGFVVKQPLKNSRDSLTFRKLLCR
jgi:hypothetical protein